MVTQIYSHKRHVFQIQMYTNDIRDQFFLICYMVQDTIKISTLNNH